MRGWSKPSGADGNGSSPSVPSRCTRLSTGFPRSKPAGTAAWLPWRISWHSKPKTRTNQLTPIRKEFNHDGNDSEHHRTHHRAPRYPPARLGRHHDSPADLAMVPWTVGVRAHTRCADPFRLRRLGHPSRSGGNGRADGPGRLSLDA